MTSAPVDAAEFRAAQGVSEKALFVMEAMVADNHVQARAMSAFARENMVLINKNYIAAFLGNRQLLEDTTVELIRHRKRIIKATPAVGDTQERCKAALGTATTLAFLAHRSELAESAVKISRDLADVNNRLERINEDIAAANRKIMAFNEKFMAENDRMLESGTGIQSATNMANTELVAANVTLMSRIQAHAVSNRQLIAAQNTRITADRARISASSDAINADRKTIFNDRNKIDQNRVFIARLLSKTDL